ncbi:MAG: hypothetical protein HQL68_08935 [Magnetococcales bacterium]|nr:hypothetical protein [Magnetococcales bacterium]
MAQVREKQLQQLLSTVKSVIAFDQPKLSAVIKNNHVIVEGCFSIVSTNDSHKKHGVIAEFLVKIIFSPLYPTDEPRVLETGNCIKHTLDNHINTDGSCCIVVWEEWITTNSDNSVQAYFDGPLKNFFLSQHIKKTTGEWPFGEYPHGKEGLLDAFTNVLECSKNETKVLYLLRILSKDRLRGHWNCPCKSGKTIRKCCLDDLVRLRTKVPSKMAQIMSNRLQSYDRKKGNISSHDKITAKQGQF